MIEQVTTLEERIVKLGIPYKKKLDSENKPQLTNPTQTFQILKHYLHFISLELEKGWIPVQKLNDKMDEIITETRATTKFSLNPEELIIGSIHTANRSKNINAKLNFLKKNTKKSIAEQNSIVISNEFFFYPSQEMVNYLYDNDNSVIFHPILDLKLLRDFGYQIIK